MMARLFTSERFYAGLVFVPIVVLAMVFAYGFVQRQSDSAWCNSRLLELRGQGFPIDDQSLATTCLANASSEHTDDLLKMLSVQRAFSHDALSMKLNDVDDVVGKEATWDAAPFAAAIAPDKAVIVNKINALGDLDRPIWIPVRFDGFNTMLPEHQQARSLIRRGAEQFRYHFHEGEHAAALEDLRAMNLIRKQVGKLPFAVTYLINIAFAETLYRTIGESFEADQWADAELEQLRELIGQEVSDEYDWPTLLYGEQAGTLVTLGVQPDGVVSGRVGSDLSQGLAPFGASPVHLRHFIECKDELAAIENVGEQGFYEAIDEILDRYGYTNGRDTEKLAIVDGPWALDYAMDVLLTSWEAMGNAISRAEMTRRVTLTSIALKQYQSTQGKWPEALSELREVGLSRSDYQFRPNRDFGYMLPMEKGDGAWLWTPAWDEVGDYQLWNPDALPDDVLDDNREMRTAILIR